MAQPSLPSPSPIPTPPGQERRPAIPHIVSLTSYPDFRSIWLAGMFSFAGMWSFIVAAGWMALERSDSSGWVGVLAFAGLIPFLIVSPIGGLLADRMDRRRLIVLSTIFNTIVAVAVAVAAVAGSLELWHLAVAAFVGGGFRAAMEPGVQALIPNQVQQKHLLNAITLNGLTHHGSRFFGLVVAAPLLAVDSIGVKGVLVLSAALTGMAIIFAVRCRTVSKGEPTPQSGVMKGMVEGLAYVYTHKTIAVFILLVAFHCALVMSFESMLPIYSRQSLGATDGSFSGWLGMGFGAGSAVGILILAGVSSERMKGRLLLWGGVASGLTPILLAVANNIFPATLFTALMGASQATFMAITAAYVLTISPDRLRGRISSLYVLHAGGIMAFANLGYGFLADVFTATLIFQITGGIFVVFVIGISASQPLLRRVYRTGQLPASVGANA
jgi:MFS family permease